MTDIYGLHQPYDRGYGVRHRNIDPNLDRYKHSRNGKFTNQLGEEFWFWVDNVEANFEIVGSTVQSRKTRQFYPHNMAQPSVTITGVAPSNFFFNRLSSYVRKAQWQSITTPGELGSQFRTVENAAGKPVATPTMALHVIARHQKGAPYRRKHRSWRFEGYVKNIKAGGEKANVAPMFTFDFILAAAVTNQRGNSPPLVDDSLVLGRQILSWMDIFRSRGGKGWEQDPAPKPVTKPKANPNQFDTSSVLDEPNPLNPDPNGNAFTPFGPGL